jgi:hypothetical protein
LAFQNTKRDGFGFHVASDIWSARLEISSLEVRRSAINIQIDSDDRRKLERPARHTITAEKTDR